MRSYFQSPAPVSHREQGVKGIASLLLHYLEAMGFINPRS